MFIKIKIVLFLLLIMSSAYAQKNNSKSKSEIDPSSVNITWIKINEAGFMMGNDEGFRWEKPVHWVRIKDFYMSKTEVTVAQYRKCVEASVCSEPDHHKSQSTCNWGAEDRDQHPVNCVDWNQARTFAKWVGGDLPSEAQWIFASQSGGKSIKYPWGNAEANCKYAVIDDNGKGCSKDQTWAVCSKTSGNSAQGLCDMIGNVWEWVLDEWHDSYEGAPGNHIAWCIDRDCRSQPSVNRVHLGNGWYRKTSYLKTSNRNRNAPDRRFDYLGFRVSKNSP